MWPLCPTVAMGTVPVLQEAGRAVSCFEEGLSTVFLQSACPEKDRKPRAWLPLLWVCGGVMPMPGQPGGAVCGNGASGKKPTWPAPVQEKKKPGRKGVATSSTDLESHPVIKTPIWTCPAPNPVLTRAPPCPGDQAAGLLDKH